MVDDRQAITILGFFHIVRGEKDGEILAFPQFVQTVPHGATCLWIESGRVLVENEYPWPVQKCPRDFQAPPHAARKRAHGIVGLTRETNPIESLVNPRTPLRARNSVNHAVHAKVLSRSQAIIDRRVLKE